MNDSDSDISVTAKMTIGTVTKWLKSHTLEAGGRAGTLKFHSYGKTLLRLDPHLTVSVKMNEVKLTNVLLKNQISDVNKKVDEMNSYLQSFVIKETAANAKMSSKVDRMSNQFQVLESKISKLEAKISSKVAKPKCPSCHEDFNSSSKIAQCISGHLVCWNCNQKNNNKICLCGKPVNGRAHFMESYLRSIFD